MEGDTEEAEESPQRSSRSRRRRPEDILTPKQYVNYQHGRILSGLFVFFGCIFTLVGIAQAVASTTGPGQEPLPPMFWVAFVIAGLAGVVGGVAAYRGNRAWARLAYLFAALLVFGCPIGTIVSILWLIGLSRYMDAWERVRRARVEDAELGAAADRPRE